MKNSHTIWFYSVLIFFTAILILPYLIPLPARNNAIAEVLADPAGKFITVDNYTGFYIDKNSNSSKVIVLLHGLGSSTYSWQNVTEPLNRAGYRTIAIDLKGFGMTQKGYDVDYSHPAQAAYVVALLKQLGVTQAIFVGHSMGGNVLAFIAATYPEMVQKMIFVDPALFTTKQSGGSLVRFPPFRRLFQQIMLRYITEARLKSLLQSAYDKKSVVSDETVKAYAAPTQIKDWELSFLGMVRDSGKNTLDISRINKQLPVLILWGENDTWVPIKQATVLTDYFTNETFIKIPDIGHVVQEEKPEEFVKVLIPFVDR